MITNSKRFFYFTGLLLCLYSCSSIQRNDKDLNSGNIEKNLYANKFRIQKFKDYSVLTIVNPLQNSDKLSFSYQLAENPNFIPDSVINENIFIKTPVSRVICLSTTHIGFIEALNETKTIIAVANGNLVNNTKVINALNKQEIIDIGNDRNLNYELLLNLKPDIIFAYGIGAESLKYINKLNELGLKVVIIAEYLEDNPLAKTEWLKVFSLFYQKEEVEKKIFNKLNNNYKDLIVLVNKTLYKPKILTGLPWKGIWYIPGGKSYLSKLIEDAGGDYLWAGNQSKESLPLSFEEVFHKAQKADIWINTGAANTKPDILSVDSRIADFPIFTKNEIYNNNAIQNKMGGNDYWESGIVHPDIILKDLIKIFHPELLPNYKTVYYKRIISN
ncbi:MAG: ABC transporter substrate-binding protein [Chlorobi bacterium]|nr:ABC transporter substrate-binding protein [Chlorobiota bacterium]